MGPNSERFLLIKRTVIGKSVIKKKKQTKETMMNIFLKRVTPLEKETHVCFPEGSVILGDDRSKCVTAPKDLPVVQDIKVEDSDIDDPDHV